MMISKISLGNLKLDSTAAASVSMLVAAALLSACATTPTEPVAEKLDPDTAVTVTVLSQPVELYSQTNRTRNMDPFSYIAPFETNRMGARDLFLWVSTPQASGQLVQPNVMCNGQPLALQPLSSQPTPATGSPATAGTGANVTLSAPGEPPVKVDLSALNLSRAPYNTPVPWGTQWYFRLPPEAAQCLASADTLALTSRNEDGSEQTFVFESKKQLAGLDTFTRR